MEANLVIQLGLPPVARGQSAGPRRGNPADYGCYNHWLLNHQTKTARRRTVDGTCQ